MNKQVIENKKNYELYFMLNCSIVFSTCNGKKKNRYFNIKTRDCNLMYTHRVKTTLFRTTLYEPLFEFHPLKKNDHYDFKSFSSAAKNSAVRSPQFGKRCARCAAEIQTV